MSHLLDTNVLSETMRRQPDPRAAAWIRLMPEQSLFTSVLCFGEILSGIERLPPGARRERLRHWLEHDLTARFGDRVLAVDDGVALTWGRLTAATAQRPLPVIDGLLAATALHHDLTIATRNESDFARAGVRTVNPWLHER